MHIIEKHSTPIAILIAGILIAGVVFFTNGSSGGVSDMSDLLKVKGSQKGDHVLGSPDAPITIIDYSDPECPFCKRFHLGMTQLMDFYATSSTVQWKYRHYPLSFHPKAQKESEAQECAFDQGGDDAFWKYTHRLYEVTQGNNSLDEAMIPKIATDVGLDATALAECVNSGKNASRIQASVDQLKDIVKYDRNFGTPYTILMYKGEQYPLGGAVPPEQIKAMIDDLLKNK
jgi:protein-disulfide isomerase